MKRGSDYEAELLSPVMPIIVCDIFPPADILNRLLAAFMSARPLVAFCLTPTIFKVNAVLSIFISVQFSAIFGAIVGQLMRCFQMRCCLRSIREA